MKSPLPILFVTVLLAFPAAAAPLLHVETTITEQRALGGKDVLAAPQLTIESGKRATVRIGHFEYAVTPTLLPDGTVELRTRLSQRDGATSKILISPQLITKLDQTAGVEVGQYGFTTKASLAK